jgi:hypothetical protein
VVFKEFQQVGHLLEVGRDIRTVAAQVNIVELNVDDVFDAIVEFTAVFALGRACRLAERDGRQCGDRQTNNPFIFQAPPKCYVDAAA